MQYVIGRVIVVVIMDLLMYIGFVVCYHYTGFSVLLYVKNIK